MGSGVVMIQLCRRQRMNSPYYRIVRVNDPYGIIELVFLLPNASLASQARV